ncbi:lipid II flippase MurJ [Rhodococcus jostii]|uniref:lipid II flippase MurJ n=1 Tax=Rhodococcus jostii TaxID=132919 RepID=UPI003632B159
MGGSRPQPWSAGSPDSPSPSPSPPSSAPARSPTPSTPANTFPTIVYELLIGGVLASVLIPMLTTATQNGAEYGRDFTQRMLALTTLTLAVVTVIAVTAAPLLAHLFVTDLAQRTLTALSR